MIIRKIPRYAILSPFIRRYFYIRGFKEKIVGEVRIEGLGKEKTYAIHIHEFGDCSSPNASGGHFDPYFSGKHGKKSPFGRPSKYNRR